MFKKFSEHFTQGSLSTAILINLSQAFPGWVGYPVAHAIGTIISWCWFSPLIKAIRLNQWVAHDGKLTRGELNRVVRQALVNQAHALYAFNHNLDRPERIRKLVKISPKMQYLMDTANQGTRGTMMLIPHLCGFDIGGILLGRIGFHYLTLSYPNPPRGYEWQNEIRNQRGEEVMPMSFHSLQLARERLESGDTVMTGIDRPYPGTGYFPRFFDRPAELPVAYMKLALKTNARVFVVGFLTLPDQTYEIDASDEIPLQHYADPRQELEENVTRVLAAAEVFIRRNPTTWAMFYPVWPKLAKEIK